MNGNITIEIRKGEIYMVNENPCSSVSAAEQGKYKRNDRNIGAGETVYCPVQDKKILCDAVQVQRGMCNVRLEQKIECSKSQPDKVSLYNLIPKGTLLQDFVSHVNATTDAPDAFAFGAAMTSIAAAMRQKIYMRWGNERLHPNLYMLLIAESGGRKSTTINIASALLRRFDDVLLPNEMTPEILFERLSKSATGLLINHEFGGFREALNRSYNKGMKEFITQLYDTAYLKRQIKGKEGKGEEYVIDDPAVSIFTASTLSWIQSSIVEADMLSGFMQRFTIIKAKQDKVEKPFPPAADFSNQIIERIGSIYQICAEMKASEEASLVYEEFYLSDAETNKRRSALFGSFQTRLYTAVWKFAMIYAVMFDRIIISVEDINYAIKCKLWLEKSLFAVFAELTKSKSGRALEKIMMIINSKEGNQITREDLIRETRATSKDLDELIRTLLESGQINISSNTPEKGRKKTVIYCATN